MQTFLSFVAQSNTMAHRVCDKCAVPYNAYEGTFIPPATDIVGLQGGAKIGR
jgi:hypothetical protein